jgi:hypothetical protein
MIPYQTQLYACPVVQDCSGSSFLHPLGLSSSPTFIPRHHTEKEFPQNNLDHPGVECQIPEDINPEIAQNIKGDDNVCSEGKWKSATFPLFFTLQRQQLIDLVGKKMGFASLFSSQASNVPTI